MCEIDRKKNSLSTRADWQAEILPMNHERCSHMRSPGIEPGSPANCPPRKAKRSSSSKMVERLHGKAHSVFLCSAESIGYGSSVSCLPRFPSHSTSVASPTGHGASDSLQTKGADQHQRSHATDPEITWFHPYMGNTFANVLPMNHERLPK